MKQQLYLSTVLIFSAMTALADFRSFEASIEESHWSYKGSSVRCELSHSVPFYGDAYFYSKASRRPNMVFILDSLRNPVKTGKRVDVRSMAPVWNPGIRAKTLKDVTIIPGEKTLNILNENAWRLLLELESGRNPTFFYRDFADDSDRLSIGLSAINFKSEFQNFLHCIDNLLPYDFREIQYTRVSFNFNRTSITDEDKKKLDLLSEFLKYDPDIALMVIEGHTDSIGRRRYNRALGLNRAKKVREYMLAKGVDKKKLRVITRGERRPLESNATREGQALNRRVFITLEKAK